MIGERTMSAIKKVQGVRSYLRLAKQQMLRYENEVPEFAQDSDYSKAMDACMETFRQLEAAMETVKPVLVRPVPNYVISKDAHKNVARAEAIDETRMWKDFNTDLAKTWREQNNAETQMKAENPWGYFGTKMASITVPDEPALEETSEEETPSILED